MLKPGATIFDLAALLSLIASLTYAIVAILTHRLRQTENGVSMAFDPTAIYIILSSVIGLFLHNGLVSADHPSIAFLLQPWAILAPKDVALLVLIGIGSAIGFYFISQAYRLAQPAAIAPFEYVSVPLCNLGDVVEFVDLLTFSALSSGFGGHPIFPLSSIISYI